MVHLLEGISIGVAGIEKRLDAVDERLDGVDKRLAGLTTEVRVGFERVDRRLGNRETRV